MLAWLADGQRPARRRHSPTLTSSRRHEPSSLVEAQQQSPRSTHRCRYRCRASTLAHRRDPYHPADALRACARSKSARCRWRATRRARPRACCTREARLARRAQQRTTGPGSPRRCGTASDVAYLWASISTAAPFVSVARVHLSIRRSPRRGPDTERRRFQAVGFDHRRETSALPQGVVLRHAEHRGESDWLVCTRGTLEGVEGACRVASSEVRPRLSQVHE